MAENKGSTNGSTATQIPTGYIAIKISEPDTSKTFVLRQELLTKYSLYFSAAFKGSFREASERILELDDVRIEIFEHVVKWMKHEKHFNRTETERILMPKDKHAQQGRGSDDDLDWEYIRQGPVYIPTSRYTSWLMALPVIKVYIFADTYDTPMLRQEAPDHLTWCIIKSQVSSNIHDEVMCAYKHTAEGSPLRRLLVDAFCRKTFVEPETPESMQRYPKEFLVDVLFKNVDAIFSAGRRSPFFILSACDYHEHEVGIKDCTNRINKY